MKPYLPVLLAALLACNSEPTTPAVQDTIEATVIQKTVYDVISPTGTTKTDIYIDVTTLGFRDPNDVCRGLYSVHLQSTTLITYSDAPGIAVEPAAIVTGGKIRVSPGTPSTTGCNPKIEAASIVIVRP